MDEGSAAARSQDMEFDGDQREWVRIYFICFGAGYVLITTGQTLHKYMCPCIALWVPVRIMGRFISRMMLYHLSRCSGQILSTSLCVEFSEFTAFGKV